MIWLYRFFYLLALIFIQALAPLIGGKLGQLVREKNHGLFRFRRPRNPELSVIWIHAASGEIEYARPLLKIIKARYPQYQTLVTFSSPSAIKILENLQDVDFWGPLPWDLPWSLKDFIQKWQPSFCLIARTDAWPEMLEQNQLHKISTVLFSATFAENSSRLQGISKLINLHSLKKIQQIACVSEEDILNLKKSGYSGKNLSILGDTRFDQVFARLESPKPLKDIFANDSRYLILGSTWPEDEKVILPCLPQIIERGWKVILAPHEVTPAHLNSLIQQLGKLNLVKYSQADSSNWDALLVDQIGILAELYTKGTAAFVGGSFKKQVHSVMEPLAAGLPVSVGPFHKNNREALQFQYSPAAQSLNLVTCIHSSREFLNWIDLLEKSNSAELKTAILTQLQPHRGTSERFLSQLLK